MLREECRVGMIVEFGRDSGEWTRGTIIKINPTKAKVKTLEARGSGRGSFVGAEWGVPYSMMRPATSDGGGTPYIPKMDEFGRSVDEPLPEFMSHGDTCIVLAIVDAYNSLSPEFLTADGERPAYQVHALRQKFQGRLSHLFRALGRSVSESVAHDWAMKQSEKTV